MHAPPAGGRWPAAVRARYALPLDYARKLPSKYARILSLHAPMCIHSITARHRCPQTLLGALAHAAAASTTLRLYVSAVAHCRSKRYNVHGPRLLSVDVSPSMPAIGTFTTSSDNTLHFRELCTCCQRTKLTQFTFTSEANAVAFPQLLRHFAL